MNLKDILQNIAFPFPTLFRATKLINRKIEKLGKSTQKESYPYEYASNNKNIEDKVLLDTLKETIENKKILEDKAKSTLIAITISSTLIINILKFLQDIVSNSFLLMLLLIIVGFFSLLYMIAAGVLSLYSIGEINTVATMYPEDHLLPKQEKKTQIADNIEHNYLNNLKRNNFMTTSYKCMISSISLLVAVYIISTLILGLGFNEGKNATQVSRDELKAINYKLSAMSDETSTNKQNLIEVQKEVNDIIENEKFMKEKLKSINLAVENLKEAIINNPSLVTDEIKDLIEDIDKHLQIESVP